MPANDNPSILLVEDSEDDMFFFSRALQEVSPQSALVHVADGAAAVERLKQAPAPDLIFLDLKIPILNGFEVLEWIRAQNFDPQLEVAILSGSDHPADIKRAMGLGAVGYYVKPLAVSQLRAWLLSWRNRRGISASVGVP